MAEKNTKSGGKKGEQLTQEKIINTFQQLRMEQRTLAAKLTEMEAEKNEHATVMDALKKVDPERRCFRMVGGVLVERTVKDVLPALQYNSEQLTVLSSKLMGQLTEKGKELNAFKLKHGIQLQEERDRAAKDTNQEVKSETSSQGVLISK